MGEIVQRNIEEFQPLDDTGEGNNQSTSTSTSSSEKRIEVMTTKVNVFLNDLGGGRVRRSSFSDSPNKNSVEGISPKKHSVKFSPVLNSSDGQYPPLVRRSSSKLSPLKPSLSGTLQIGAV